MLCALIHSGQTLAGERIFYVNAPVPPLFPRATETLEPTRTPASPTVLTSLTPTPLADQIVFSPTDFRPRKRTLFDPLPTSASVSDNPMLRGTTVWQRMSDYKSRDRVRLLTLWETSGSSVSLQAGKHGDPSLQWTSRLMNRGGSTRGLLDQLFSVSLVGAGASLLSVARFRGDPQQQSASKQVSMVPPAMATAK